MCCSDAKTFFENFISSEETDFMQLSQSGSARQNFIGTFQNQKYIITCNDNIQENDAFLYFSDIFSELHLNTPKIFRVSEDRKMYIQEFLGSQTLSEIIQKEKTFERINHLVKQTLEKLFELQQKTEGIIDYTKTFEYEAYDEIPVMHDLFYFKFMFADLLEVQYNKAKLIKEFGQIANVIKNLEPKGLMIRDFQSRNIMVNDKDRVYFIDYQSAMEGPLMYDVISFLYQAKANFPETFRQEMINYYCSLWKDDAKTKELKNAIQPLQLMRFLQVLGAYGFRGIVQKKTHFINSIQQGIENLYQLSQDWKQVGNFPELQSIILQLHSEKILQKVNKLVKDGF